MKKKILIIVGVILCIGVIGTLMDSGEEKSSPEDSAVSVEKEIVEEEVEEEEPEEVKEDPVDKLTTAQRNAYESAQNYLDTMPFSKQGLIDQLSSEYGEGYEKSDAEVAVNTLEKVEGVDWVAQAEKAAQNYLDTMSFSKDSLVEQLESDYGDKYTHEQAVKAVDAVYK